MIAYNTEGLDNKNIQGQAERALAEHTITSEEHAAILTACPVPFYTPNFFIRIGLFLLTVVIVLCSGGLLTLMVNSIGDSLAILLFFTGLICIGVLEYLVYGKRHFRSGADDALLWLAAGLIFAGIDLFASHITDLQLWILAFVMACWCTLRYADRIMALAAFGSFLGILFYTIGEWGGSGRLLLPFSIMAASAVTGWLAADFHNRHRYRHYRDCLVLLRAATLLTFYGAGNIIIVREWQISFFGWRAAANTPHLLEVFFWAWSLIIPLLYLVRGILKKDRIFLWMGLAGVGAAIYTIRYYHPMLPLEWAMAIGGAALITLSYSLISYLRKPRSGFTFQKEPDTDPIATPQLESLLIAETFPPATPPAADGFQFGGGTGGGGGAGGQY